MNINMLKHNPSSNEPLEVDEYNFFKYYLELLQVKAGKFLSDSQISVLAYVLAGEMHRSYWKRPASKEIEEFLGINSNHLHQIKNELWKMGIISRTDIRGDYVLHKRFLEFQRQMKEQFKKNDIINFQFKLRVNETKNREAN